MLEVHFLRRRGGAQPEWGLFEVHFLRRGGGAQPKWGLVGVHFLRRSGERNLSGGLVEVHFLRQGGGRNLSGGCGHGSCIERRVVVSYAKVSTMMTEPRLTDFLTFPFGQGFFL